jgi:Secretion system C-terminal sorting domain
MGTRSLPLFAALCFAALCSAQAPAIEWQKTFGGSADEAASSIAPTNDGGYAITGGTLSTDGDVTGNHGGIDYWVVKLNNAGGLQWQRTLGGSGTDSPRSIAAASDGGYIVAGYSQSINGDVTNNHGGGDCWIVKLDSIGSLQWQKTFGGSDDDIASDIKTVSDGGYIVAGETSSSDGDVTDSNGFYDCWVLRLDSLGGLIWQKTFGGGSLDRSWSISPTSDGGFIMAGETGSFDGDVTNNHGMNDLWVIKLDAMGNMEWEKCFGGSSWDEARSIVQTMDHGYIVAGSTFSIDGDVTNHHGLIDSWVVKLDSTGNLQWQKAMGGTEEEDALFLAITSSGGYLVAGSSRSDDGDVTGIQGICNWWLMGLDSMGNLSWQRTLGGSDIDWALSATINSDGSFVVAGRVRSTDGDVTDNHGFSDCWAVKLTFDFNSINGQVFGDLNNNAVYDAGDVPLANHGVHSLDTTAFTWTHANGDYELTVLDSGNVSVEPSTRPYYTAVPATHTAYFNGFQQTDPLNDFAFQPTGAFNDLAVSIAPATAFRPGFPAQYIINCRNVGTTALVPNVVLHNDLQLVFDSSSVAPTSVAPDSIAWELPALGPLEQASLIVYFTVNQGAVLGSTISSPVTIAPLADDAEPSNNAATWDVLVTGSFDPNDKAVNRNFISPDELSSSPDLEYIIRFQNTGTDTAFTVRIEDHLSAKLQRNSLEVVGSSHPLQLAYTAYNDLLTFQFNNILLPDSNTNEEASHGYVHYRIKPLSTLQLGDSILNYASIFFDYNAPIVTNTAYTVIESSTAIAPVIVGNSFSLYPNPAKGSLLVSTPQALRNARLTLTDALGREVLHTSMNGTTHTLAVGDLPRGLYVVTLRTDQGNQTQRVVLE